LWVGVELMSPKSRAKLAARVTWHCPSHMHPSVD
jgi:hypothetical protein